MTPSPSNSIGQDYLLSRPFLYNGGLISQLISKVQVTYTSSILDFSFNAPLDIGVYINQFFFNSSFQRPIFQNISISYESKPISHLNTFAFGLTYLLVALVSCLLFVLLWVFLRTVRYHPTFQRYLNTLQNNLRPFPVNFHLLTDLQLKEIRKRRFTTLVTLGLLSLVVLLPVIICFINFSISQANLQQTTLNEKVNTSLMSTWKRSADHLDDFLNDVHNQSFTILNQTLHGMSVSVKKLLLDSLTNLTSELLSSFGVTSAFENAQKLIINLKETIQSMQYIKDNSGRISKELNFRSGNVKAYVAELQVYIRRVCSGLPGEARCKQFLMDSDLLRRPINTSMISDHSSINMIFIIDQFNMNLTMLTLKVSQVEKSIKEEIDKETIKVVDRINIEDYINKVTSFWRFISDKVLLWRNSLSSTKTSLSNGLNTYGNIFFVITSILLFVTLVIIIILGLASSRWTLMYLFQRQILVDILQSPPHKPVSVLDHRRKKVIIYKLQHQFKIRNGLVYTFMISFGIAIVLMISLSLVAINLGHLLYNEACIQIWRSDGLAISDSYLDLFISKSWIYVDSVTKNLPIKVTIPRPSKVLDSVRNRCVAGVGILRALRMNNFVNISSLIWNPTNYKFINEGLNYTFKAFMKADVQSMIPVDITSFINSASSIGKTFDDINYQPTIDELDKGVLEIKNYTEWMSSAIRYFSSFDNSDSKEVLRLLRTVNSNILEMQILRTEVITLRSHFKLIQERRTNSIYIQGLLSSLRKIKFSFEDKAATYTQIKKVYDQIMFKQFLSSSETAVTNDFENLVSRIFPCLSLSVAVTGFLEGLCSPDSFIVTLTSYGLHIAILFAFLILIFQLMWSLICKEFSEYDQKNVSTC